MKRREPVPFQDLVTPLFQERQKTAHLTLTKIRQRWEDIVGPELSRKTHPLRVQRGVLWIAAPDSSWAYQLQFMRSEILQCLRAVMGASDIGEVRFKAGVVPAPPPAGPPAPLEPPGGGAAPAAARLMESASVIADPALRALFVRSLTKQRQRRDGPPPRGPNAQEGP